MKWEVRTGSSINGTPSIFGKNLAVGTHSGKMLMLNKFSGQEVWNYNPGYIDNIAPSITASPVTSGGSLFMASEDGNVYSLNTDQKIGPISVYTYYIIGFIVILAGCLFVIKKLFDKRKK